jgi:hypothetical protein
MEENKSINFNTDNFINKITIDEPKKELLWIKASIIKDT